MRAQVSSLVSSVAAQVAQIGQVDDDRPRDALSFDPSDGGLLLGVLSYLQDFIIGQTTASQWSTLASHCSALVRRCAACRTSTCL